jgi:hypothetical protein
MTVRFAQRRHGFAQCLVTVAMPYVYVDDEGSRSSEVILLAQWYTSSFLCAIMVRIFAICVLAHAGELPRYFVRSLAVPRKTIELTSFAIDNP